MSTRREFLGTVAAASAATVIPAIPAIPVIPVIPVIPGVALADTRADRLGDIGVQLYTVRREMAADVEGALKRVAAIGYKEVEFAGYFKREPAKLRATLDELGLRAPACHVGLDALENDFDAAASAAKTLGHKWLIVASVPGWFYQNVAYLKELASRFNALGRRASDAGLRYGYHNHNIEFKPVEGVVPLDLLITETDPALVDFEMDVYWATQGGADPLAYFGKHSGRFYLLHIKDSGGPPAHEMRDVGAGTIDWKAILRQRKKAGAEHFLVEHDQPKDPFASIAASYQYLKSLEF